MTRHDERKERIFNEFFGLKNPKFKSPSKVSSLQKSVSKRLQIQTGQSLIEMVRSKNTAFEELLDLAPPQQPLIQAPIQDSAKPDEYELNKLR
jgi:hypothetical protein